MILQEKVLRAVIEVEKGSSLKDFLDEDEILDAINMLGDILICAGFNIPEEDD